MNTSWAYNLNGSLSLSGERNLPWDGIVQPEKPKFWVMLSSLLLFVIWNVFLTFYFSRISGPVVGFILTRLARLKGHNVYISLGSFSVSLLAGKIMFRNFQWTCSDYSVRCNDGWIILSYWRFVSAKPIPNSCDTSRLHLTLNGLQIHFYNRLKVYLFLAKRFGLERLFGTLKEDCTNTGSRKLTQKEEREWDKYYDKLWALFGYLRLDIGSGRVVAGSGILPSMLVITFENYTSKISLKDYVGGSDRALLSVSANAENVRVSLVKCAEFETHKPAHFTGRRDAPPRTMGDGFAVLQTAHLSFFYNQSILGIVKDESQSLKVDQPIWESVWRLGKNTVISYGPWADAQRVLIYNYFFPSEQCTSEVTVLPRKGERRILLAHDARISFLNDAVIDIWFMRGEELNALHLRVKQGSSVEFKIPWVIVENGFCSTLRCCLLCVESSTSLAYRQFFQCETLKITLNVHFPRAFNAHQLWKYGIEINKISAWVVWDHKRFFTDMMNEWTSDSLPDLFNFIPFTWEFEVKVTDGFELILALNDKNWVDTSSSTSAENILAAVVGKEVRSEFSFPFVDFCPELINTLYTITAQNNLALRTWIPSKTPLSPVLHALLKSTRFDTASPPSAHLPSVSISDLSQGWVEIWRTEKLTLAFEYTYHPSYIDPPSELPYHVIAPSTKLPPTHPINLEPDNLLVEIGIDESEVLLTGIFIRLIVDLKNNYFGVYDRLTDVVPTDANLHSLYLSTDTIFDIEDYRPLSLRLCLRLQTSKAHCAVHCSDLERLASSSCPMLFIDQLVIEIDKGPFETLVQVNVGNAFASFDYSLSSSETTEGCALCLKTFSFRGTGFFSELDVPWDAASLEYSWLMEIVIGSVTGTLRPSQVVCVSQILESLFLLAVSPDDELQVPERYELCHHMNDIHTCERSALNLIDNKGRVRNCESEENLKYKLFRLSLDSVCVNVMEQQCAVQLEISPIRFSYCNCHETSFCSAVLLKLPSVILKEFAKLRGSQADSPWVECAAFCMKGTDIEARLPYNRDTIHLAKERKFFLAKHDKASTRLFFLWNNENSCGCFGGCHFFGSVDKTGVQLMSDLTARMATERLEDNPSAQPSIGQSIIYTSQPQSVFVGAKTSVIKRRNLPRTESRTAEREEQNVKRTPSEESFHSALSTSFINLSHHMVCPIFSSSILMGSYSNFLSTALTVEENITLDSSNEDLVTKVETGIISFKKGNSGVNDVLLIREEAKRKSAPTPLSSSKEKMSRSLSASEPLAPPFGADHSAIYIRGTAAAHVKLFITPLALEVTQRIAEYIAFALASIHPAFVAQHLYTMCAFRGHSQPLTKVQKTIRLEETKMINISVDLPNIELASFQCGLIEKTIQSTSLQDSVSHLVRSNMALFTIQESYLLVSTQQNTSDELYLQVGWENFSAHGQFLQVVESNKHDFAHSRTISTGYSTNWTTLGLDKQHNGCDLRVVIDVDIPELSLHVNVNPNGSPQRFSRKNHAELAVGPVHLTFGLCKPLDQTSSKEWPLFDVLAPCVTAWTCAAYRLDECLQQCFVSVDMWIDLILMRTLSEALDCNDEQVFASDKSCFAELRLAYRLAASCPSCKLTIILLRFAAQADFNGYWTEMHENEIKLLASKQLRKLAVVALLSHWQTIICSQIKLIDTELANKYVKQVGHLSNEVRINVDAASDKEGISVHKDGVNSARSNAEPRQMDLYHWISARHREHKEAAVKKASASKKTLDDFSHVNPMEIVLPVFFWPFYERLGLEPCRLTNLPTPKINAAWSVNWTELKVDILEPKVIASSNISYMSLTRHQLLHFESLSMKGRFHSRLHLDELKLRPIKASLDISYSSNLQNVRATFDLVSVCFFNDLTRVARCTANTVCHLRASHKQPDENKEASASVETPSLDAVPEASWLHGVLDKLRDYRRSKACTALSVQGCVQVKAEGQFSLRVVMLEMALTHLFVSMTFKKIQLSHKNQRDSIKIDKQILDELSASVQRANLILSEFIVGFDAKHIVNFSVKASSFDFRREQGSDRTFHNHVILFVGDVEGDMPIHAQNLHEVVLRNAPQLNEQMTRLEYSEPTPIGEYSPHLQCRQGVAVVHFDLHIRSIELTAQLLPSLKAKYRLDEAKSNGKTGSEAKFMAKIKSHVVLFTVVAPPDERRTSSVSSDTFTLILPHILANGEYRASSNAVDDRMDNENLQLREGGYIDVVLTIGSLEHSFTTDLLNQVLFAEQCFRAELSMLIERLTDDRPTRSSAPSEQPSPTQYPFLFVLMVRGETAPWLQLTASTPTSTAVRLTFDNISATLTNRWTQKVDQEKTERLYGKVTIGVSAKLGQLVKNAMFEEIETELQEFATFMTQISIQNKDSNVHSSYSYIITVNRPILLIKSTAIDKAILLWLNYKNTYDYWREERNKMLKSTRLTPFSAVSASTPVNENEMDVNLSLKVTNGVYVCMPLYSADLSVNMSALVISLQSTDITVCVRKELACQAAFHNFKVKFIDNFDDQALSDSWLGDEPSDPSHSNFFFFPQGTYQFVSRATAAVGPAGNPKWTLSVKWQMLGMTIDLDQRIGKLTSLLISTFSSLTSGNTDDEWEESARESVTFDSNGEEIPDAEIDETGEFENLVQPEERAEWLERKMHEQSVLVTDLMQCRASEPTIEKERRKLRKLELARFKQFRKSMLDKLKRNAVRQKRRTLEPKKLDENTGVKSSGDDLLRGHNVERFVKRRATSRSRSPSFGSAALEAARISQSQAESSAASSSRLSENNWPGAIVYMDIDVQISIESGQCTLRTLGRQDEHGCPISKRPSARDLKSKMVVSNGGAAITKLAIPSVDVKAYYVSLDSGQSQMIPRHMQAVFIHKYGKQSNLRRPGFYLAVELSSMPQESLVTPHLADFLEQMLEPLPESSVFTSSMNLANANRSETDDSDVAIVEMDTSALPLDVLFHLIVQSSTIRFEGQQQRSAAADCLLKLPSLTMMASTRPFSEATESVDGDATGGGIHLSATLSAFSLNIYSPHQQSTAHDALSLTLDRLSLLVSRSKNNRFEPDNKVQFVLTTNIGSAHFNYDMRRLAELISFPKPWYRRTIMRRLFFGDHSVKTPDDPRMSPSSISRFPSPPVAGSSSSKWDALKRKEWSATVIFAVEWKELNINAQMANTMGNTKVFIREGVFRGYTQLNSRLERIVSVNFRLKSSLLSAHGGAISGQISIANLFVACKHKITIAKPPENTARIELEEIESRIEWMSRPIFIGRCEKPSASFSDEWSSLISSNEEVIQASVFVNLSVSWDSLQMVITKVTVDDFAKIAAKLRSFFQEQLTNSRMVWGIKSSPASDYESSNDSDARCSLMSCKYRHWPCVLDVLTELQSRQKILPIPTSESGTTLVGGSLQLVAKHLSLACMHGEMNASSWALFHMNEPSILFVPKAQYAYVTSNNDIGVSVSQRVILKLGDISSDQSNDVDTECMAVVCRVQQSRGSMVRQTSSISACLEHLVGDVLKQLNLHPLSPCPPTAHHSVLPLFQFPALNAVLSTVQKQEVDFGESQILTPEVRCSFVCEFHDTVSVQTDFNAQVSFLPELLKTYMKNKEQTKEEKAADASRDFRRFICETWNVDPKIRFIDRFKWNPPVIDEILRKLQIFDHRNTIPKALQRGMLDPCDALLAQIHLAILSIAKKSPTNPNIERKT